MEKSGKKSGDLPQVGHELPRIVTPSMGDNSYGPLVAAWASEHLGFELMPWQMLVFDGMLEHDADGFLHRNESLVTVARQNGKTFMFKALLGWWLTEMPKLAGQPQSVISTAHKLDRAFQVFRELAPILEEKFNAKVSWSYGRNTATMPDGTLWKVEAATPTNAHGVTADLIVADEVWSISSDVIFDAYRPTMIARPNPMLAMFSTAGDESSTVMMSLREQALNAIDNGTESSLYYAEWSPPPGADLNDPASWAWANPALGHTITPKALQRASETPDRNAFIRAHCNLMVTAASSWLQPGLWNELETDSEMPSGGVIAVDTDVTDNRYVGVRAAVDGDRRVHVTLAFSVNSMQQMWAELDKLTGDPTLQVALTPGLHALAPPALERRLLQFGQREIITYTTLVRNLIVEGRVTHTGQMQLNEQVNRAVASRNSAGVALSTAKSPGPIEMARCMVAAIGFAAKPANSRKPMIGSSA
ncbi:MAG: terminase TerL endonuclease subunit [Ilumatobacteraceae bacterium]